MCTSLFNESSIQPGLPEKICSFVLQSFSKKVQKSDYNCILQVKTSIAFHTEINIICLGQQI